MANDESQDNDNEGKVSSFGNILGLSYVMNDTPKKMKSDGLSLEQITSDLKKFIRLKADFVDLITITYTKDRYGVNVLLAELSEPGVRDVYNEIYKYCRGFKDNSFIVNVLGPQQKDSLLFTSLDCYAIRA